MLLLWLGKEQLDFTLSVESLQYQRLTTGFGAIQLERMGSNCRSGFGARFHFADPRTGRGHAQAELAERIRNLLIRRLFFGQAGIRAPDASNDVLQGWRPQKTK
jgi:hypothetical protein